MSKDDFFGKLQLIETEQMVIESFCNEHEKLLDEHRNWLNSIRRERPSKASHLRVAIYIRYYNQTKYENYLEYHKKQFLDTLALVPNWTFVGFYVDEGMAAPNMENADEWSRLLDDCIGGKIDLVITQKISNVSRKIPEITWCARLLASLEKPVGIYFISEDVFTLASYYMQDLRDPFFLPEGCDTNNRLEQENDRHD